jgi:hypothetical protein
VKTLLALLFFSSVAWANAPAPWAVCAGKKAGDKCGGFPYFTRGRCVLREPTACGGPPQPICLMCESSCAIAPASATGIGSHLLLAMALLALAIRRARAS